VEAHVDLEPIVAAPVADGLADPSSKFSATLDELADRIPGSND
jgi:hypothetical protein